MPRDIDIAEHDVADAASAQLLQRLDEAALVIGPAGARRDELEPERIGLRLHHGARDRVRAGALAGLVEHRHEPAHGQPVRAGAVHGKAAVLATAPRHRGGHAA
jgi:hypothetical protein